jgi:hypothetical protein
MDSFAGGCNRMTTSTEDYSAVGGIRGWAAEDLIFYYIP